MAGTVPLAWLSFALQRDQSIGSGERTRNATVCPECRRPVTSVTLGCARMVALSRIGTSQRPPITRFLLEAARVAGTAASSKGSNAAGTSSRHDSSSKLWT